MPVEQLLRWRLAQAEATAPPAPSAARLLQMARPWRETLPEQFQSVVERLGEIQVAYGHAVAEPQKSRCGHPVPVMMVRVAAELEASARVLYLSVRDGRLCLRFQLETVPASAEPAYEATIISEATAKPLFSARASLAAGSDYRLEAELAEDISRSWAELKVTDRMPFRLILRSEVNDG